MPFVAPLPTAHDPAAEQRANLFAGTLGLAPNSVLRSLGRLPLARAFTELAAAQGGSVGKHRKT